VKTFRKEMIELFVYRYAKPLPLDRERLNKMIPATGSMNVTAKPVQK